MFKNFLNIFIPCIINTKQSFDFVLLCSCRICYRLINSPENTSDTLEDMIKKADYSDEEEEEELSIRLAEDLTFQKHKYKSKSEVLQHRNNDLYDSDSDVDSEGKINMNGDSSIEYKSNDFQTGLPKYAKEQFSKSFNVAHSEYNTVDIVDMSVGTLKGTQLQRISDNIPNDINIEDTKISQEFSNRISLDKRQLLEINGTDDFPTDIKKKDCTKEETYLEDKPVCADMLCDKNQHDKNNAAYEEIKNLSTPERKKVEKDLQQTYEREFTISHLDRNNRPDLEKEYPKPKVDKTPSVIPHSDEEISDKNDVNIETQNKLNITDVDVLSNNVHVSQTEQSNSEMTEVKQASDKKKIINYNKEKLLATMKAIDDNENIEFLSQKFKNHNVNRMQIMENLHRGLPAHSKPKRDIIRDIFEDNPIENKVRSTCSKSH